MHKDTHTYLVECLSLGLLFALVPCLALSLLGGGVVGLLHDLGQRTPHELHVAGDHLLRAFWCLKRHKYRALCGQYIDHITTARAAR